MVGIEATVCIRFFAESAFPEKVRARKENVPQKDLPCAHDYVES